MICFRRLGDGANELDRDVILMCPSLKTPLSVISSVLFDMSTRVTCSRLPLRQAFLLLENSRLMTKTTSAYRETGPDGPAFGATVRKGRLHWGTVKAGGCWGCLSHVVQEECRDQMSQMTVGNDMSGVKNKDGQPHQFAAVREGVS